MGFFWTEQFESAVTTNAVASPMDVKMLLFSRAPLIMDANENTNLRAVTTVASLTALPGWEEASNYTRSTNAACTVLSVGLNRYLVPGAALTTFPMTADSQVEALVFVVDGTKIGKPAGDRVIFGTTTPFTDRIVFRNGDGVSALTDSVVGQPWFFGWAKNGSGAFAGINEGTTVLRQGAPEFESARLQHVWMLPQRINYIANPAFEHSSGFWQSNLGPLVRNLSPVGDQTGWVGAAGYYHLPPDIPPGTVFAETAYATAVVQPTSTKGALVTNPNLGSNTMVATAKAFDARVYTSPTAPTVLPQYAPETRLYVASASFYPTSNRMTFQLLASGMGVARVGLAYYSRDYSELAVDWGLTDDLIFQEWTLGWGSSVSMQGIRSIADQGYEAFLLVEARGFLTDVNNPDAWVSPELIIDQALVEEGTLLGWPYFDGDTTYGAEGDFTWYGPEGADKIGKSYSLWYNDQKAISGRLFARRVDDTAMYTSADEQLDSMVTDWVPAGTTVVPHFGTLGPNDTQIMPVDRSAEVLPVSEWPEQTQPFEVYDILDVTNTSATFTVVGEGGYPITRGYIRSMPGVYSPDPPSYVVVTVAPRPWQQPGLRSYEIDALLAQLYDPAHASEVTVTWTGHMALSSTNVLYLERGSPNSPPSFLEYALVSAAGAETGLASATANTAAVLLSMAPATATVTATAYNAGITSTMGVGDASATGEVFTPSMTVRGGAVEQAVVTAAAYNATAVVGLFVAAGAGASTVTANDSAVSVRTDTEQAAAAAVANNAVADIAVPAAAVDAVSTATALDPAPSVALPADTTTATAEASDATVIVSVETITTGIGAAVADNAAADLVSIPTSLSVSGATASALTLNWAAPATFNNPATYQVYRNGVYIADDAATPYTFTGLAANTAYTLGVRAVSDFGAASTLATISGTTINPDNPVGTGGLGATIVSFKPETNYGRMYLRWTNPSAADLDYIQVWRSINDAAFVLDYTDNAPVPSATGRARNIAATTYASGTKIEAFIRGYDLSGNHLDTAIQTYTLIDTPINVSATATNNWRSTNGGEWDAANNHRPYQGYFSDSSLNYMGFYFYSNGISSNYLAGRRTCTSMRMFFVRAADTGSSVGHTPVIQAHKIVSNPGDVTSYGTPTLYEAQTSTGLSLGFSATGYYTLPAAFRDGLFAGTYEGIAHRDTSSPVYASYMSKAENSLTGYIEINHLG